MTTAKTRCIQQNTSFAQSFVGDLLHNLIYVHNISTLPSKQVIRTKRINPISLKWMTFALRLTEKLSFVDTDSQTGNRETSHKKPPEPSIHLFAQEIGHQFITGGKTQFTKGEFVLPQFIKFSKIQINAGFRGLSEFHTILITLRNPSINEFSALTKSCVFMIIVVQAFFFSFPLEMSLRNSIYNQK